MSLLNIKVIASTFKLHNNGICLFSVNYSKSIGLKTDQKNPISQKYSHCQARPED